MRISSIDLGSNALRLVIVEADPVSGFKTIKKHRESIRLGEDVFHGRVIRPETLLRLVLAFKRIAKIHRKYKVEKYMAFATSAFRDARNKSQVIREIQKKAKIKIKVISGKTEADLIRRAVLNALTLPDDPSLLIDIGGGSVELTVITKGRIEFSKSFKLGMVRVLSGAEEKKCSVAKYIDLQIKKIEKDLPKRNYKLAVGTGGNLDAMARLKMQSLKKAPNFIIYQEEIQKMYDLFCRVPLADRPARFQIKPDRADVLEPALYLTNRLLKMTGIKKMKIPGVGLKEGALLSTLD